MKKILIFALVSVAVLSGCKNQENEFADFDYTTTYFPYQYPVRTLILGDYTYDNTNDNNHEFLISAAMGGVYSNTENRILNIKVDESLCNRTLFSSTFTSLTDTIRVMPSSYYTLSSYDSLVIPAGKFYGSIVVKLKDAFFDDPLAIKLGYVIPIRITGTSDVDSVLSGKASVSNPDPRVSSNWTTSPKNFTMFAVKYINPYDGQYLHRGLSIVKDASGNQVEKTSYRTTYIENNELWRLYTTSKNQVSVQGTMRSTKFSGTINLLLDFSDTGECTVKQNTGSAYTITGSGKFVKDADSWGNQTRDAIYLNYQFANGTYNYSATDTLVIRDRAVVLETYTPTVF
jgi:hypothetical protein